MLQELEKAYGNFMDLARIQARSFEDVKTALSERSEKLNQRETQLDEREARIQRRESEVDNIRQLAASRKAELEASHDALVVETEARRKAEAAMRASEREKTRLESVVATLIAEKAALAAELEAARKELAMC